MHSPEVERFGRYEVIGPLGEGGMGQVFEAFDPSLDRKVAVKVLHADLAREHTQRLVREAQALARLSHPNVVQVYEVGVVDDRAFVAMELVVGQTLRTWSKRDPRPSWRECVELYLQAGNGLAAAHAEGLVHRDFKPGNVIVDDAGRVRVLDFGLARSTELEGRPAHRTASELLSTLAPFDEPFDEPTSDNAQTLTRTGTILGTLAYMPLEQMLGREVDARGDQFCFCVSLYEAIFGERPFDGQSPHARMLELRDGQVSFPRDIAIPTRLRHALSRGLACEAQQRWPTMEALLRELRLVVAPRRRGWVGLALAGGLAALGIGIGTRGSAGPDCSRGLEQLDGIWDETRQQQVTTAIVETGLPHAADTEQRVRETLDAYVQRWSEVHTEICEAAQRDELRTETTVDLQTGCLTSARLELRAAVDVLSSADPARVTNAIPLVTRLPAPDRCDDIAMLQARLSPPQDPAVAEGVELQRAALMEVRALRVAGEHDGSMTLARTIVEEAEAQDYPPLLAEALLERGIVHRDQGQYVEAERDLQRSYLLAIEHQHEQVELTAAVELIFVVGYRQAKHDRGTEWGSVARALSGRPHGAARDRGRALSNTAVVLVEQGKLDEALGLHVQAKALLEDALGPRHLYVAMAWGNAGLVLEAQGKLDEALAHYQTALDIRSEVLGPRHPDVAKMLTNLGNVLRAQGRSAEALEHHQRALTIESEALGPDHIDLAATLGNVGALLDEQGHAEQALEHHQRALTIRTQRLGPDHPDLALSMNNIAALLQGQGRNGEAIEYFERGLDIQRRALGERHPDIAISLSNLGYMLAVEGRTEEALAHHRRALDIAKEALGAEHPMVALLLVNVGDALGTEDGSELARERYEQALTIATAALGAEHPDVAYPLVGLARIALARNEHAAAREHAERAYELREAADAPPAEVAEARFLLARCLWADLEQRSRARTLAEQAREDYGALGQPDEHAKVTAWLEQTG